MDAIVRQLAETLRTATADKTPLRVSGGSSKDFYGNPCTGETLSTTAYCGIIDYEPTELVITARAGTPLAEIEAALKEQGQMLAFEPPHFGASSTLGGCIAAGLSGPRRPYAGAVRDLVLGVRILDGTGADLKFGGQVMKNVAGYDVSRLMAGAMGTLGVILEVSLKTLPLPAREMTLQQQHPEADAIRLMNTWAGLPLPISATAWQGGALAIRLSGAASAVDAARRKLGGEVMAEPPAQQYWQGVRDHSNRWFKGDATLWRVSIASTAPPLRLPCSAFIEWGGALRWLRTDASAQAVTQVREAAAAVGGHATCFRTADGHSTASGAFHPLSPALLKLHQRLKMTFDPARILNLGRLYPGM